MKGHQGIADLILDQPGVDLNFRDDRGSTLVMLTAAQPMSKYIVEQMEYLLRKGAKVDLVDANGQNAVSKAEVLYSDLCMHGKVLDNKQCYYGRFH